MFNLGLLSLLQVWFLPGLSLLVISKQIRLIDKLILSLPLSIFINYLIIFILILFEVYNQSSLLLIILFEILIILYFLKKNKDLFNDLKSFIKFLEFKKINFKLNIIDIIVILIFFFYIYLAFINLGNIVGAGDSQTFYKWTLDIINNKVPKATYDYPLGPSFLASISYVLLKTTKIEFFSSIIYFIYPLWIFLVFYRSAFLLKKYQYEIKFSLIFTSLILLYNFRHYLLFFDLPDPTLAMLTSMGAYILILAINKIKLGINYETILFCLVMSSSSILKQYGVYTSILFPIMYLVFFYKKNSNFLKIFIFISLVIFISFSPWYIFKYYQIYFLGTDISMTSVLRDHATHFQQGSIFSSLINAFKILFGYSFVLIIFFIIISLKFKYTKLLFIFFLLPYLSLYVLFIEWKFRAFAPAMPAVGILCGYGFYQTFLFFKKNFSKKNLIYIYYFSIFSIGILFLGSLNYYRDFNKLLYLQENAMKKRGNYELNVLLYNFLRKDDDIKTVYVIPDYNHLHKLPDLNHKFIDIECSQFIGNIDDYSKKSFYIIIDKSRFDTNKMRKNCKKDILNYINLNIEKNKLSNIFEYKKFVMYLKN